MVVSLNFSLNLGLRNLGTENLLNTMDRMYVLKFMPELLENQEFFTKKYLQWFRVTHPLFFHFSLFNLLDWKYEKNATFLFTTAFFFYLRHFLSMTAFFFFINESLSFFYLRHFLSSKAFWYWKFEFRLGFPIYFLH